MQSTRLWRGIGVGFGMILLVVLVRLTVHSAEEPRFEKIFSPLYQQFDAASLAIPGATPTHVKSANSWNTASLLGSRELHGILELGPKAGTTADVFRAAQRAVDAVTSKHHVEGDDPRRPVDKSQPAADGAPSPSYAMWMYNWESRHGELHVWLFPDPDGSRIGFAVHLIEETLH